jgi:hypothetical protein
MTDASHVGYRSAKIDRLINPDGEAIAGQKTET